MPFTTSLHALLGLLAQCDPNAEFITTFIRLVSSDFLRFPLVSSEIVGHELFLTKTTITSEINSSDPNHAVTLTHFEGRNSNENVPQRVIT